MSEKLPNAPMGAEGPEWWETIPDLDLWEDINPELFVFVEEKPGRESAEDAEGTDADIAAVEEGSEADEADDPEELERIRRRRMWWRIKPVLGVLACLAVICVTAVLLTAVVNQMSVAESLSYWAGKLASQWDVLLGRG